MNSPLKHPVRGRPFLLFLLSMGMLATICGCTGTPQFDGGIKLLVIGNSFTDNSVSLLPAFASEDGAKLTIFRAILGGAPLAKHAAAVHLYETNPDDPAGRPYRKDSRSFSLVEALQSEKWTHVSIQELLGAKTHNTSIHLQTLVDLVRAHAPQAHILLFEPWSPREDRAPGKNGVTSSQLFYEQIHAETLRFSRQFDLAILPVGTAFQNARNTPLWRFNVRDPAYDYDNPVEGTLPDQTGSLNHGWQWTTDSSTGRKRLSLDASHCNRAGSYLAAAVLYEMISNRDVRKVSLQIKDLTSEQAESLRAIAHSTVSDLRPPAQ